MIMKVIDTIRAMSFDELNDTQKSQAYDVMRDIDREISNPYWAQDLVEQCKEDLDQYGLSSCDIQWSGFSSQGDGASISAESIEIETFLRKVKKWSAFRGLHRLINAGDLTAKMYRGNERYSHEYTVSGETEFNHHCDYTAKQEDLANDLTSLITETVRQLSRDLYRDLESDNDYHSSDEYYKEYIECNDYHFKVNADGKVLSLA